MSAVAGKGGVKGKRDVACTGLPVSWMPVKFPEYYSVHRSPPRDTEGLSGKIDLGVCSHRPGLNRSRKRTEKGEENKKGLFSVVSLHRPAKAGGSPKTRESQRTPQS